MTRKDMEYFHKLLWVITTFSEMDQVSSQKCSAAFHPLSYSKVFNNVITLTAGKYKSLSQLCS